MGYLRFVQADEPRRRTHTWRVESRDGRVLGAVRWYSPWRRYTYTPIITEYVVVDAACLLEIVEFLKARMAERADQ